MAQTTYARRLRQEGLPVISGYGVTDVHGLALGDWQRLGGRGAFIQLEGMEGLTGMYVAEIPPRGSLEPEKHLYDELIYILSGQGVAEVWNQGSDQRRSLFEWQTGSVFAPPLNTWHRLSNASGSEPARFLGVTTAPIVMDLFHNVDFVMNSEFVFLDRYDGRPDYFSVGERWGDTGRRVWETNFIPDVKTAGLDISEGKGKGGQTTLYEISENILVGQLSEWPVGRYRKAHHHGGGAILLTLGSEGYALMWPRELGPRPYKDGHGDQVVRVEWGDGSVMSPPSGWFHQFFNTGRQGARNIALRYGSQKFGVQFHDVHSSGGVTVGLAEGGTMIEPEDEDPYIGLMFKQGLEERGIECLQEPVTPQRPAVVAR